MNLHFDPAEFAPIIEAAVEAAFQRVQNERSGDGDGKILLNKSEAAEALGVSVSTVDRLRRDAGLPVVKLEGLVMFRPEALKQWARDKEGHDQ